MFPFGVRVGDRASCCGTEKWALKDSIESLDEGSKLRRGNRGAACGQRRQRLCWGSEDWTHQTRQLIGFKDCPRANREPGLGSVLPVKGLVPST